MNVLLTSVGRRGYLVEYFRDALAGRGRVLAANSVPKTPGMLAADQAFVVPSSSSPKYGEVIARICTENDVRLLCPCHDLDALVLSTMAKKLADLGVTAVVPDERWARLTLDKLEGGLELERAGLRTPWTVGSLDEARLALASGRVAWPLLVKARYGYGSLGLSRCDTWAELEAAVARANAQAQGSPLEAFVADGHANAAVIQELVAGLELRVGVLNDFGGHLVTHFECEVHAMRGGESEVVTSLAPTRFADFARSLSTLTRHIGFWGVDVIWDEQSEPIVLDVNPRFTGEYAFLHTAGADVPRTFLAWLRGETPDEAWLRVVPNTRMYKDIVPKVARVEPVMP